ncbi:dihydroxyacetone kinase phosphoryl donor subunit DhaM [Peribacillus kribbensis]|uniref:dihydroxyacetone kinase phosphoryl donor subunit DhaM n=1 Tax=Peribacillus kribbensis TaxID=356658 RepID=UPI00040ED589|nr:dihydroxyacetone kinase phosphoryl donor subunit DhaM [Peribacillus kribbensis]
MSRVGIVFISHSEKIAMGLKELVTQVIKDVPIEAAGGTEDGGIGTSLEKIQQAIEKVYSDKGVIVLYDLGSSVMNAELAIEVTGLEHVKIADAPLVEGGYVAAVESGMGKPLDEVLLAVEEVRMKLKRNE